MNQKKHSANGSITRPLFLAALGVFLYATLFTMTSCRTVHGFGQDVQDVGNEIEDAAR